ncbi:MAG: hypothetical protein JWO05_3358 [Gemmatimonadetes bacterium]|nr:hypothetical protein [Gemmatimonadota bacterium]
MARSYGARLLLGVAALGAVAAVVYGALTQGATIHRNTSFGESSDSFAVRDPSLIRPTATDYAAFAAQDAAWRAKWARPYHWQQEASGIWAPSAEMLLRDRVYRLVQAGRPDEAIPLLESWLTNHPGALDLTTDLARMHASLNHVDDAARWYRLALERPMAESFRPEFAKFLLDAGRYPDAQKEWQKLALRDPLSVDWRLQYARALAWGGRSREAERELSWVAQRRPNDPGVDSLLVATRNDIEPSLDEARRWSSERPAYRPWRVAYARALVAANQPQLAMAQFDTLLDGGLTLDLLREAAGVHGTAGDSVGSARMLRRVVAMAPRNDTLRVELAKALAWSGDRLASIAEYDTLLATRSDPQWHRARGEMLVWAGDYARGEKDLRAALAAHEDFDLLALLGDVQRWTGRYDLAKATYRRALALKPTDARVTLALADADRLGRQLVVADGARGAGWTGIASYAEDNSGFLFVSAGVSHAAALGKRTLVSMGLEQNRVSQRSVRAPERYIYGYSMQAGITQQLSARLSARVDAGLARHALTRDQPFGSVTAAWEARGGSAQLSLGSGPVYQSLMSINTLLGSTSADGRPMMGRTASASATIPVRGAAITAEVDRLALSDGNTRTSVQATARIPVAHGVNAIYTGGTLGYSQRSAIYWDPLRYTSHGIGLEVAGHRQNWLTWAVRAVPGVGRSRETSPQDPRFLPAGSVPTEIPLPSRNVFQLATSGDVGISLRRLNLTAGMGYGRGRGSSYQSLSGALQVHFAW